MVIAVVLISVCGYAQNMIGAADRRYNQLAYSEAIPLYEYALKKDSSSLETMRKLGTCYRVTNNWKEAEAIYARLVIRDYNSYDKFYYAEALLQNGKYQQAKKTLSDPATQSLKDPRVTAMLRSLDQLEQLLYSDTANVKVASLKFNSKETDFAPAFYGNGIVFASSRRQSNMVSRNHTWTNEHFVNLYYASRDDNFDRTEPFAEELRSKYNYGPATFYVQGQQMYYVENNPKKKSKNGVKNLKIQSAKFENNKWKKTAEFPYNSNDYACAHPSLSSDGQLLYFSSNMPGGYGGMDIYVCRKTARIVSSGNKTDTIYYWEKPQNLGHRVNSTGDELFPFADQNKRLFFASDGQGGLGGLDIFSYSLADTAAAPENLGAPVNSSADDFGLIMYANEERGFFSSDRGKEGIDDDIYSFQRISPKHKTINVFVIDALTKALIDSSKVDISSAALPVPLSYSGNGRFFATLAPASAYQFEASANGYQPNTINRAISKEDTVVTVELFKLLKGCIVQGTITHKETGAKMDSVLLTITNTKTNTVVYRIYTNQSGFYRFEGLDANIRYTIAAARNGYFSKEVELNTKGATCVTTKVRDYDYIRDLQLDQIVIGKAIRIENIYFDLNKYNIRPDAAKELDKIVTLMNDNPEIIIELSSHTDSRGSDASNMVLSDNRAKSSAAYIISKGISDNRITGKGYGETMLVNRCANGVACSETEHQQNRRTEFKVTGFITK